MGANLAAGSGHSEVRAGQSLGKGKLGWKCGKCRTGEWEVRPHLSTHPADAPGEAAGPAAAAATGILGGLLVLEQRHSSKLHVPALQSLGGLGLGAGNVLLWFWKRSPEVLG